MPTHAAQPDDRQVLTKALLNAGRIMGLSQTDLGEVIGMDRSVFNRGVNPASKPGELALLLIRAYRSVFVLVGGQPEEIKHWFHTENRHTGGVPAEQVKQAAGLVRVVEYLDAMRGRA
jgi:hypothetical protein